MLININEMEIFKNSIKTLKETSLDDSDGNKVYMTNLEIEVIDFDNVKKIYCNNKGLEQLMSNDVLYQDNNGNLIFIEFKNGNILRKNQAELKIKIYDSLLILSELIEQPIPKFEFPHFAYALPPGGLSEGHFLKKVDKNF